MKKYLLGLFALVLAIGFSAFNLKPFATTMYYHGPSFLQSDVQNKTNWNTTPQECIEGFDKACQVSVADNLISSGAFISTVTLEAEAGSSAALLTVKNSGSAVSSTIVNRD
jgi:hypothetical protein